MMNDSNAAILARTVNAERLSDSDCLRLFQSADLLSVGQAAHQVRMQRCDPNSVTYNADRNINYTNVCTTRCSFCAFSRDEGDPDSYVLSEAEWREKIAELYRSGGSQILLQGGLNPHLTLEYFEQLLRWLRAEWPHLHLHCFSPHEIDYMASTADISIGETLARLRVAGLQSVPGGGAEILSDRPRHRLSPRKISADEWIKVMREVSRAGLRATATMMFGHRESMAERVEHLRRLRHLQDETGVFTAFIAWTFQPKNARPKDKFCGSYEYLRTIAIARLYLDNIVNHQASWVTQGPKVAQISLRMGINDLGSTMIEENVVREAGTSYRMNAADLESLASEAGFSPRKRDCFYGTYVHPGDAPEGRGQTEIAFPSLRL